jgi:hypothetical protein
MKRLSDLMQNFRNKQFVKKFEADKRNYENGTLLATTNYLNASIDIILYNN